MRVATQTRLSWPQLPQIITTPAWTIPMNKNRSSYPRAGFHGKVLLTLGGLWWWATTFALVNQGLASGPDIPANIDVNLQRLAANAAAVQVSPQNFVQPLGAQGLVNERLIPGRFDRAGRVLVHLYLDGSQSPDAVEAALKSLGVPVIARKDDYRYGIMTAWLPKGRIVEVVHLAGIRSLTMECPPQMKVGKATSQGTVVLRTNLVNNLGIKGDGITVGVLSDSFNTAQENEASPPATTAEQDVSTGDLPVVKVLEDFDNGGQGASDEGRAMCQIVYDLAPHCNLAFATAAASEVDFANNIIKLRTEADCDVLVDDAGYSDEPVFSDGFLAQAVNVVATSTALPGKKVVYASAAGNEGNNGYRSVYHPLSDAQVRQAGGHGNLKLDVKDPTSPHYLDPSLTAGGWHNWNPDPGAPEPFTTVTVQDLPGSLYLIGLQWDDLFDQAHGITVDYQFLVFDQDGNYLPTVSGTTDAIAVQQPVQTIGYLEAGKTYQIAITQSARTDRQAPAPPVHHLALYRFFGQGDLTGKHFNPAALNVPTTFGHAAADSAIAVAAYEYDYRGKMPYQPVIEYFTAPGPAYLYFDQNYRRLAVPIVRAKPDVAAVDGVATTFFGQPYFSAPYSFFGTSAAAPHVAGVAALMLQAGGGPGSLDTATVRRILQGTAPSRDIDPLFSSALGASSSGFISVTSQGTPFDTRNFVTVSYLGSGRNAIDSLTIDGSKAGLIFDITANNPSPAVGDAVGIKPGDVTFVSNAGTDMTKLTLKFKPGTFVPGASVSFTVDQDVLTSGVGGNSADLFGFGAIFTASLSGAFKDTVTAAFQNQIGTGYNPADGYGLIDALPAVESVLSARKPPPVRP